jgi:hypothetical protein
VCVDTRRGAGSGLAKQKIRKKRNQEGNDRSLCTLATTSAGRTFNTNGSSPFAHLFFANLSFHYYYYLLFDHRRWPFIFENKTSDEMKI